MSNQNRPIKLAVNGLSKTFNLRNGQMIDSVRDLSFDVHENEFCALLGPSGCGKSTALRIVAGLEEPSDGSLTLDGHEIIGADKERGLVFQNYTSFDWLTVRQNVEYGMKLNGIPAKERRSRVDHYVELVRLTKFMDAYPRQLSGGMKQRVAIARTLANEPSLLLMDEPFGALDAETRWNMQELMISIMETTAITAVMVTHDIEEALFLADRIVMMSRHPGTLLENQRTEFKGGRRIGRKEDVLTLPGYTEAERRIMSLMRAQAQEDNYSFKHGG